MHMTGRVLAVALLFWASAVSAQTDGKGGWDQLVAAAQKEGTVVVLGPPDNKVRKDVPEAFKKRFGITIEYIGGRSTEAASKLRTERSAGLYTADVLFAGSDSMAGVYYPEKMLAPLKPELVLPQVVDSTKWTHGGLWFADPEKAYVLRLFNTAGPSLYINTDSVKPGDLKSAQDLLDPKWKGKISAHDPTVAGRGVGQATRFYLEFGEDFLRKLYVDQKPMIVRDRRQLTDWLARGTYPISLDGEQDDLERLRKQGLPIQAVYQLGDMGGTVSSGIGQMGLVDHAPHPNAAKVFVNWMASKEGLEVFSRARGEAPTRNDIDATAYLPAEFVPKPGVKYYDVHDWTTAVAARKKVMGIMRKLLKEK